MSRRSAIIADYLAAFHHEANVLERADIGDRISGDGDQVSEFSGFDSAHPVLPPSISAALLVTARRMSSGGIPASRRWLNMRAVASPRVFPG